MSSIYGTAFANFPPNVVGTTEISKLITSVTDVTRDSGHVYVKDYLGTESNQTENVKRAHAYANANNCSVSYSGISSVSIDADAQITVNTSVDFAGCNVILLNGYKATPNYQFNTTFNVTDPENAVVTLTGQSVTDGSNNLKRNSMFPTLGVFDGMGWCSLEAPLPLSNRNMDATMNYVQSFRVERSGLVTHPLAVDLTAYNGQLTVKYRKLNIRPLVIQNFKCVESGWNNQRFFNISRCNVALRNITIGYDGAPVPGLDYLISVYQASDIVIEDVVASGRTRITDGCYVLHMDQCADVYVNRVTARTGWGATGCNNLNGVTYTNCCLSRLDCHSGGFNMFADSCNLLTGMTYGWGGGTLSVKNSRIYGTTAIDYRGDYGGTFFGTMIVSNCEFVIRDYVAGTSSMIELGNIGSSVAECYFPENVLVKNNAMTLRNPANMTFDTVVCPLYMTVLATALRCYHPLSLEVSDISCSAPWRCSITYDHLNTDQHPIMFQPRFTVINCQPNNTEGGISDLLKTRTTIGFGQLRTIVRNCHNMFIRSRSNNSNMEFLIDGCTLNAVELSTSFPPMVSINNCRFLSGYSPSSPANFIIGSGRSGGLNFTSIRNCEFTSIVGWNLSLASVLVGNIVRAGGTSIIYPTGCNAQQIFNGYIDNVAVTILEPVPIKRISTSNKLTQTANTNEQLMYSILIPGGSIGTIGHAVVNLVVDWPYSTATLRRIRLRLDTVGTGTTGTILWERSIQTTTRSTALTNYIIGANNNNTSVKYRLTDVVAGESGSPYIIQNINTALSTYLKVTLQTDNVTDLGSIEYIDVETVYRI